jgi:peptide deformylase
MKNHFALILTLVSLVGCSYNRTNTVASLKVPEDGFELVQHTNLHEERNLNSLYLPSRKVEREEFDSEALHSLIQELRSVMHLWKGVGIAANQVGKNIQLFLIEADINELWHEELDVVPFQLFINPKITRVSKEKRNFWHGCLSTRGEKLGNVASYEWIEYEAYNATGEIQGGRLNGFAAVIFQHELRHLLGGTYLDKAAQFIDTREFYSSFNRKNFSFFERVYNDLTLLLDDYVINETIEEYYFRSH